MFEDDEFNGFSNEGFGSLLAKDSFNNIDLDQEYLKELGEIEDEPDSSEYVEDNLHDIDLPTEVYDLVKEYDTSPVDGVEYEDEDIEYESMLDTNFDDESDENFKVDIFSEPHMIPNFEDNVIDKKTKDIIDNVSKNIGLTSNDNLMKIKEEDHKIRLCIEIEQLCEEMLDYVPDTKNPEYNQNMSVEELTAIRDMLATKCNVHSSRILVEEFFIFFGKNVIEKIFNGKNSFFGKRPNLTGWTERKAIPRLSRAKFETAKFAKDVYTQLGIGPKMKLLLDLGISMFNYAFNDMGADINNISDFEHKMAASKLNERSNYYK